MLANSSSFPQSAKKKSFTSRFAHFKSGSKIILPATITIKLEIMRDWFIIFEILSKAEIHLEKPYLSLLLLYNFNMINHALLSELYVRC